MSEFLSSKRWSSKKILRGVGAVTAAAAFYGAGAATHAEFFKDSNVSAGDIAVEAQGEITAYNFAVQQAKGYENALNDPNTKKVPMQILNGEIRERPIGDKPVIGKGGPTTVYKNPILLYTPEAGVEPDASGNFLKGAWLAVQNGTADPNGKVTLSVVPFYPAHEDFKAYNPDKVVISDLSVYTQHSSDGPTLIAFDPTGNRFVENPDHTTIQPGLMVGLGG